MNPIKNALEQGHEEEKILDYLSSKSPKLKPKIQQALRAGYTFNQILSFLSSQFETRTDYGNASQQAIHSEKKKEDIKKNIDLFRAGLGIATGVGVGKIATKALPKIAEGIAGGLLRKPPSSPSIPQQTSVPPPIPPIPQAETIPMGEQTQDYLGKYARGVLGKEVPDKDKRNLGTESLRRQFEENYIPKTPKQVLLPDGELGIVKEQKQGIATIDTPTGKVRRKKIEEVIPEPEEAAVKALDLLKSFTPEQERSSHHALSFYDPDDKEAYFLFHNGTAYQVGDINPEEYERLSTEVDMAKTAGQSPYGIWATGEGSRGAAYHQIVKKLNKPYKKLHVGYNILKNWQRLLHEYTKKQKRKQAITKDDEEID